MQAISYKNVCIPAYPFTLSVLLSADADICQLFLVHVVVSCYSKMPVDNAKMSIALVSITLIVLSVGMKFASCW